MCILKLILIFIASILSNTAFSAEYREIQSKFGPFASASKTEYLHPVLKVSVGTSGLKLNELHFSIRARQGDITLSVASDGNVRFPISDNLYQENPPFETNAPKGSLSFSVGLEVSTQPIQRFNYDLYYKMADEYTTWTKSEAGFLARMHMPGPKALLIRFPIGTHGRATVYLPSGSKVLETDSKNEIRIEHNDEWKRIDPMISLNTMPDRIEMSVK